MGRDIRVKRDRGARRCICVGEEIEIKVKVER